MRSFFPVVVTLLAAAAAGLAAGQGLENADEIRPVMRSRTDWGAAAASDTADDIGPITGIVLGHTAISRGSWNGGDSRLTSIQNSHQNTRGWKDISYHVFVGHGPNDEGAGTAPACGPEDVAQLYEARSLESRTEGLGESTPFGEGKWLVGIAGSYESVDTLRDCQVEALGQVTAWLAARAGLKCDDAIEMAKDVAEDATLSPGQDVVDRRADIVAACEAAYSLLPGGGDDNGPAASFVDWLEDNLVLVVSIIVAVALCGLLMVLIGKNRQSSVDRAMGRTMSPSFSGKSPGASQELESQSEVSGLTSISVASSTR